MSTRKSVSADVLPITKDIPVPAYAALGKAINSTLSTLKSGESFEVPETAFKALQYRVGKFPPKTFTLKTKKGKIRVWKL
jgi:hypothetical protein